MARTLQASTHHRTMEIDLAKPHLTQTSPREVSAIAGSFSTSIERCHSSGDDTGSNRVNLTEAADLIQMEDEVGDFSTDTESDLDKDTVKKPPKISQRRKAQDVAFSSWLVIYGLLRHPKIHSNLFIQASLERINRHQRGSESQTRNRQR